MHIGLMGSRPACAALAKTTGVCGISEKATLKATGRWECEGGLTFPVGLGGVNPHKGLSLLVLVLDSPPEWVER
eukprot:scaffold7970_cov125-Isochrysis_galbana.AAC.5